MTWTLRTNRQKKKHYVILLKAFAYGFKGGEASGPAPPGSSLIFREKEKERKTEGRRDKKNGAVSGRETEEDSKMSGER